MNFDEYQRRASITDQNPKPAADPQGGAPAPQRHEVIPLLGLVGEVGGLLTEYKKLLRDGATHRKFRDEVAEELGDILWYVSNVASKFRAGGYLSAFLDEAIAQGLADDDMNDSITAIELSQYLHERYRADVKSARPVEVVRNEMTLGYQHLVIDRGSIGAYDVLFER